jgi:integrase/recombinase XerD
MPSSQVASLGSCVECAADQWSYGRGNDQAPARRTDPAQPSLPIKAAVGKPWKAYEALNLDVGDLDLANKRARGISKGGAVEWVHWQTPTARLPARLVAGRTSGPVFLADRAPTRPVPAGDLDPASGRARLSYRRAAALFHQTTGWTLHQLRHSALTHEAEDGTNTPMLLARSRHASVRSLERYAQPSAEAVARHVASRDPAARRPLGP